ncbi:ATP-binding cassette domain-containing protein [Companilactobacillus zhachilii]|uniref:ATP-binding cassette domain-containing protein n=1 Tax=Companilactobacillus zhachilii TaxID=2304606 RepID=A0A386PV41_9LACO|nr:ATP-binding cassette domain-containing protein [Companilactobacillus zhachilii]
MLFSNISKEYRVKKQQASLFQDLFNRKYSEKVALKDVSFQVNKGEVVGYIGPNGAGKSTTIKIMTGILKPTQGTCRILGVDPMENRMQFVKRVGVVFGNRSNLMWDLPVIDSFNMMQKIYKIPRVDFLDNLHELVTLMNVKNFLSTPVRQLSLGQQMRCEIIVALLHSPEILFLDEPTLGLDARSKIAVHQFIKKINEEKNLTVVLTTHDMGDIEALTSRAIIIGKGSKLFDGDFSSIKDKYQQYKKVRIEINQLNQIDEVVSQIKNDFNCELMTISANEIVVGIKNDFERLIQFIVNTETIDNYQVQSLNIEEIIARYYSELDI